jgi:hypothetical protein
MNQHDLDILELGLRVKNEIWAENYGPNRPAATRLAIRRRYFRGLFPGRPMMWLLQEGK